MSEDEDKTMERIVDFLHEAGMLADTPRSGFHFLGSGRQSVAEHTNRVCYIGFTLARMIGYVDMLKVLKMCLFHDLPEARTSDLNYVHQKYSRPDESKAIADMAQDLPFGDVIKEILEEFGKRESIEAMIARDADQLEMLLSLKKISETGNKIASEWMPAIIKRLQTKAAKQLAEQILTTRSDNWWYKNPNGSYWVNRDKE